MRNDTKSLVDIYERYSQFFGFVKFYERLLAPVMYKVGELWEAGRLDVATEHVCSNAAHTLVKIINKSVSRNPIVNGKTLKILICAPEGEYHSLGCKVIESFLRSKGYSVSNIAPSVSSDSVIPFASKYNPDLIMISMTLADNIGAANKLINKILESRISVSHILVGGIGIESIKVKYQKKWAQKSKIFERNKAKWYSSQYQRSYKSKTKI